MPEPASRPIHLDAARSPAQAVPPALLDGGRIYSARPLDAALRWLTASDQLVSHQVARALTEVKQDRLYLKHGHALWSAYLRAFVPLTPRWCQQEMRRERGLEEYRLLAAAYERGELSS